MECMKGFIDSSRTMHTFRRDEGWRGEGGVRGGRGRGESAARLMRLVSVPEQEPPSLSYLVLHGRTSSSPLLLMITCYFLPGYWKKGIQSKRKRECEYSQVWVVGWHQWNLSFFVDHPSHPSSPKAHIPFSGIIRKTLPPGLRCAQALPPDNNKRKHKMRRIKLAGKRWERERAKGG